MEWIGIRACDDILSVGDRLPASRIWVDGWPTDEMLPGTSCLDIASQSEIKSYPGAHIYIISGDYGEWGNDPHELIIRDAIVTRVIR